MSRNRIDGQWTEAQNDLVEARSVFVDGRLLVTVTAGITPLDFDPDDMRDGLIVSASEPVRPKDEELIANAKRRLEGFLATLTMSPPRGP